MTTVESRPHVGQGTPVVRGELGLSVDDFARRALVKAANIAPRRKETTREKIGWHRHATRVATTWLWDDVADIDIDGQPAQVSYSTRLSTELLGHNERSWFTMRARTIEEKVFTAELEMAGQTAVNLKFSWGRPEPLAGLTAGNAAFQSFLAEFPRPEGGGYEGHVVVFDLGLSEKPSLELLDNRYVGAEYAFHSYFVFTPTLDGGAYLRDLGMDHDPHAGFARQAFSTSEIQGVLEGVVGLMPV